MQGTSFDKGIRCELCVYGKPADCEQQRFCSKVGEGLTSPYEIRVLKDFGCIFFKRRVEVEKCCNICKHWEHSSPAFPVTWSGCSARSHEHEVLMTRESHYCDKWEESMTDSLPFVIRFDRVGSRKANYVEIAGIDMTRFVESCELRLHAHDATTVFVEFVNVTVNLPQEEPLHE